MYFIHSLFFQTLLLVHTKYLPDYIHQLTDLFFVNLSDHFRSNRDTDETAYPFIAQ